MKNPEDIPEKDGSSYSPLVKKIIIAIVVTIVLFLLLVLGQISMFIEIFNWLVIKVKVLTGLDMFLAKGIAAILFACLLGAPLGRFIWSFLPIPQKDKKKNRFISLSILSLLFFVSFFVSQNVFFNSETGKPLKYYVVTVGGEYKFSSSDGYDPATGKKFKPVIKEVAQRYVNGEEAIDYPEFLVEKQVVVRKPRNEKQAEVSKAKDEKQTGADKVKNENKNDTSHKQTFLENLLWSIGGCFVALIIAIPILLTWLYIIEPYKRRRKDKKEEEKILNYLGRREKKIPINLKK